MNGGLVLFVDFLVDQGMSRVFAVQLYETNFLDIQYSICLKIGLAFI
jgi:hypothetical protein